MRMKQICFAVVAAVAVLASFAQDAVEPEMDARIVWKGNLPKISINGRLYEPDWFVNDPRTEWSERMLKHFTEKGLHLHGLYLPTKECWKGEGQYDFSQIDRAAKKVLEIDPEAYYLVSVKFSLERWCRQHPEEAVVYAADQGLRKNNPTDEAVGMPCRPSAASLKLREEIDRILAAFGEHVKSVPWGRRIFALRLSYGIYTEWHTYGMWAAPDVSRPMTEAFHRWRNGKYANETPPSVEERSTGSGFILDPKKNRKAIDFFVCQNEQIVDLMHFVARSAKRHVPGRLVGMYYGYVLTAQPPEGANVLAAEALASPDIDFLSDPPEYTPGCRSAGGTFYHRAIPSVCALRGKLSMLEDDTRFHHMRAVTKNPEPFTLHSADESRAVMLRNYFNCLIDQCGVHYNDPGCNWGRINFFDDPSVLDAFALARKVAPRAQPVSAESGNEVVAVVSAYNRYLLDWRTDRGAKSWQTYVDTFNAFTKSGYPHDVLELKDYLADKTDYKAALFLNLYELTADERKALIEKTRQRNMTAIWVSAAGSATEQGFSDAAMSELTGIALSGAASDPKIRSTDNVAVAGPADTIVKSLDGGARSIVMTRPPRTSAEMSEIMAKTSAHRFAEPGNCLRRRGDLVLFHTGKGGSFKISMPEGPEECVYEELVSGRKYKGPEIAVDSAHSDTWLFKRVRGGK